MLRRVLVLKAVLSVALLTLLPFFAAPAFAQGVKTQGQLQPLESDSRLGPLFARGIEALTDKRLDEALKTFEDLYRQSPRPTLLYYLGKVALLQERQAAAADLLRRFVKGSGEDIDPDTRAEVQQILTSLPAEVCDVAVQGDSGALLLVDGRLSGALPLDQPLQLSPGSHKLTLEKGRRKVDTQVMMVARRRAEVRFTLVPPLALLTLTPAVLLVLQTEPKGLEPSLTPPLQGALQAVLAQENSVLVSKDTQAELLRGTPTLSSCLDQVSCQERLGQMASAQFVLHLQINTDAPGAAAGGDTQKWAGLRFVAKLIDVEVGMVSVQSAQSCTDCNVKQALGQISETVQDLLRQAIARPRGTLVVSTNPPGAGLLLDGRTLGVTPYHREAFVGRHELSLTLPGHLDHHANIQISENESTELKVTLPAVAVGPNPGAKARRIAKWALLGSGAVLTLIGGTLLGLNKDCAPGIAMCSPFDGRSSGIPLLVLGVGALGASGAIFLYDSSVSSGNTRPSAPAGEPATAGLTLLGF